MTRALTFLIFFASASAYAEPAIEVFHDGEPACAVSNEGVTTGKNHGFCSAILIQLASFQETRADKVARLEAELREAQLAVIAARVNAQHRAKAARR